MMLHREALRALMDTLCLHDFTSVISCLVVWLRGAAWSLQHPSPLSPAYACNPAAASMRLSSMALEQHCNMSASMGSRQALTISRALRSASKAFCGSAPMAPIPIVICWR